MSTTRSVSPGKSRKCPHCRSEILESASICPKCRHHLKFGLAAEQAGERIPALHVEGTIRHPAGSTPWEYSVVITVRNQKGEEVAREIVGIGSMSGNDLRTFDLSVDVFAPEMSAAVTPPTKAAGVPVIQTSTVSPTRVVPRQGSTLSPARTVPPPPRQTSTVSASRSISQPSKSRSATPSPSDKGSQGLPSGDPSEIPPKGPSDP